MPEWLLASLPGVVSGLTDTAAQREDRYEQFMMSQQLMAKQHQYNLQYMGLQDQLNSPAHQRDLLEQAGFNASMMLQDNPNMGVSQPSAPGSPMNFNGSIDSLLTNMLKAEDLKSKRIQNDFAPSLNRANLKKLDAETDRIATDRNFTNEQWEILKATRPFVVGKSYADWQQVIESVKKIQAESKLIGKQEELTGTQNEIAKHHLSFEEFRTKWRESTGLDYNDDNAYSVLYGLYKTGELSQVFESIGDGLKSVLGMSSENTDLGSGIQSYLNSHGRQALNSLPSWLLDLLKRSGFDVNTGSASASW